MEITYEQLLFDVRKSVLRSSNNAALADYVEVALKLAHSKGVEEGLNKAIAIKEGKK